MPNMIYYRVTGLIVYPNPIILGSYISEFIFFWDSEPGIIQEVVL